MNSIRVECQNYEILDLVTELELSQAALKMKWNSTPTDSIPVYFYQKSFPALIFPLSILFSTIFITGQFLSRFKSAQVVPLFKGKGSPTDTNNHRDIVMLPSLSKFFE